MLFLADTVIHGGQFNSFNLLLTLVAPMRNWLSSIKSSKRLKVFNFNLENETFFELMLPKLLKKFSCIKWKRSVL